MPTCVRVLMGWYTATGDVSADRRDSAPPSTAATESVPCTIHISTCTGKRVGRIFCPTGSHGSRLAEAKKSKSVPAHGYTMSDAAQHVEEVPAGTTCTNGAPKSATQWKMGEGVGGTNL